MITARYRLIVLVFLMLGLATMFVTSFQSLMRPDRAVESRDRGTAPALAPGMDNGNDAVRPAPMSGLPEGDTSLAMTEQQADEVTRLMRTLQTNPNDAEALTKLGETFVMAQEWPRAEVFLTKAMLSRPADPRPRYMLGICLYRQNKMTEAAKTFEELLAMKQDPAVMFNLAVIYKHHLDQADKAAELLRKIIENPEADTDIIDKAREELAAK